ncbi:HvfC/BufC N-terminal domain-containing protein [Caulobacter sp. NIBR2454]|uniref:HvfC/BufC N-terminal domain-containing protein n=1 Tax=Caulobacter sp. NIBR2454 TaxID=3015996 RepID=UPI0022B71874|nr:DNA-binding domain-containing protein [Caulobacter sp. NIBR2454]
MPALNNLTAFQDAFTGAIAGDAAGLAPWLVDEAPGLSVYRNTIATAAIDALAANYPVVVQIVGEDWFRAAAARFAADHPPRQPSLSAYGEGFADWLAGFGPAAELPYLPGIARLDRLWTEAHLAADYSPLNACDIAVIPPARLPFARVRLHPALRWASFEHGLPGLWLASRAGQAELEIADAPQAVLIARPRATVETRLISPAAVTFLEACHGGLQLHRAMAETLARHADADLSQIFAGLIAAGAFASLR